MLLTVDNVTQPITEWALDYGIPCTLIRSRLRRGWGEERAVTEPMVQGAGKRLTAADMRDEVPKPKGTKPPELLRKSRLITFDGESLTVNQWAERLGLKPITLRKRLYQGWPLEQALKSRLGKSFGPTPELIEYQGEALTVREWAERLGLAPDTLRYRLNSPEWTLEEALASGNMKGKRRRSHEQTV